MSVVDEISDLLERTRSLINETRFILHVFFWRGTWVSEIMLLSRSFFIPSLTDKPQHYGELIHSGNEDFADGMYLSNDFILYVHTERAWVLIRFSKPMLALLTTVFPLIIPCPLSAREPSLSSQLPQFT